MSRVQITLAPPQNYLSSKLDIVIENDLYVYSWDNDFICTGQKANPPKEFIKFVIKKYGLTFHDNYAHCPHITKEIIKNKKKISYPYLLFIWKSANVSIGICKECASKNKNFLFETTKYLIEPDIQDDFILEVIGTIIKDDKEPGSIETNYLQEYFSYKSKLTYT